MNSIPTATLMELGAYHFPKALLPSGGPAALLALEDFVQGSTLLLYECRLLGPSKAIDVSTKYWRNQEGCAALLTLAERMRQRKDARALSEWDKIRQFAKLWTETDEFAAIENIYLEFDCQEDGGSVRPPAIFFSVKDGAGHNPETVRAVLDLFYDVPPAVTSSILALSHAVETYQGRTGSLLGLMLSRDPETRIMIKGEDPDQFINSLRELAWAGDIQGLGNCLNALPVPLKGVRLVLGYDTRWKPDVGLEIFCDTDADHHALRQWLSQSYAVDRTRLSALETWFGGAGVRHEQGVIHEFTARAMGLKEEDFPSACHKTINHYKLNFKAGDIFEVKAYLGLSAAVTKDGASL